MSRLAIFRLAAMLLLLLTAGQLLGCEMLDPFGCDDSGAAQSSSNGSPDDACICCCRHIVVARPVPFFVAFGTVTEVTPLETPKSATTSFPIYHPPKA
jgi:hypothetical protein